MILKNRVEWAKYVALHAPITFEDAEQLYLISTLKNVSKESIVKGLHENGGDYNRLYREISMK